MIGNKLRNEFLGILLKIIYVKGDYCKYFQQELNENSVHIYIFICIFI
jgi:hypothetical protein